MSANVGEVEDVEGEAEKAAHMYLVGGKPGGGAYGVAIGALDMREV